MRAKPVVVVVPVGVVCELVLATGSELALTSKQTRSDTINMRHFHNPARCEWVVHWSWLQKGVVVYSFATLNTYTASYGDNPGQRCGEPFVDEEWSAEMPSAPFSLTRPGYQYPW